jgi:large subunit ribosomal protein L16
MFKIPFLKKNKRKQKGINILRHSFVKKKTITNLFYGSFGLKAVEHGRLTPKQFETIRRIFSRKIKKKTGKFWFRIIPSYSITRKPNEMRMGKGKGQIKYWIMNIKAGMVLFEISGISLEDAYNLLSVAKKKLPIKTKAIFFRKVIC